MAGRLASSSDNLSFSPQPQRIRRAHLWVVLSCTPLFFDHVDFSCSALTASRSSVRLCCYIYYHDFNNKPRRPPSRRQHIRASQLETVEDTTEPCRTTDSSRRDTSDQEARLASVRLRFPHLMEVGAIRCCVPMAWTWIDSPYSDPGIPNCRSSSAESVGPAYLWPGPQPAMESVPAGAGSIQSWRVWNNARRVLADTTGTKLWGSQKCIGSCVDYELFLGS